MTNLPITGNFTITAIYGQKGKYWADGHKGIDFVSEDKRIYATCDGVVRTVAYDANGWGQYVSIGDDEGRRHIFCHLVRESVTVKAGDKVTRTTIIGTMGATGNVTGVHLHYQLQNGETVINPCSYLGVPNKVGSYNSNDFQIKEVSDVTFKDQAKISDWAKSAVDEVSEKGWMLGDDKGNFNPQAPVTREELAVVLARIK